MKNFNTKLGTPTPKSSEMITFGNGIWGLAGINWFGDKRMNSRSCTSSQASSRTLSVPSDES
eukprot:5952632-Amphidinium_carterae.1